MADEVNGASGRDEGEDHGVDSKGPQPARAKSWRRVAAKIGMLVLLFFLAVAMMNWLVVWIIGLPGVMGGRGSPEEIKLQVTKTNLGAIRFAMNGYLVDHENSPPDLRALITGKYLNDEALIDSWGHPYRYVPGGLPGLDRYELGSLGPDGIAGTTDDIDAWDVEMPKGTGGPVGGGGIRAGSPSPAVTPSAK